MNSYKRILIPISNNKVSLDYAIDLSNKHNAELFILYTYRLNNLTDLTKNRSMKRDVENEIKNGFQESYSSLLNASTITYSVEFEVGFMSDRLVASIAENSIDLLLLNGYEFNGEKLPLHFLENLPVETKMIPESI